LVFLVALAIAVVAAPAFAQKFDIQSRATDVAGIPEGGIDYNVVVDDTGNLHPFIDATVGTQVFAGDDELIAVTWPFDFSVYNNTYVGGVDQFEINSNGSVHFDIGGPRTLWINCGDAPSTIDGQWVAPLGDDLDPTAAGEVWWAVTGTDPNQVLTVAWLGVPEFGGTGSVDIQANFIQGSNVIVTQYIENSPPDFLGDGVVGINAGDGVVGNEVACAANGTMPRPVHDVEYTPACSLTAVLNGGAVIRPGDAIWADITVEHAKPGSVTARATAELIDLRDGRRVSRVRFGGLQFEQFQRTSFGGAITSGLEAGRYSLEITLNGMSGWERRTRQLVVVE
jgi:hypothetical protein